MPDYGDYNLSAVVRMKFSTNNASAVPTTLAGTPAAKVYKTNSTTESASGVSLTVDFDGVTGLNHVDIDTSSDGTFYAAGCDFQVVITAGTVGGVSVVGAVVGSFSLLNRSALRPATAGRTAVVDAAGLIDATTVKVGPSGSGTGQTARDLGASVLLAAGQKVDVDTIKTNPVVNAGTVTFPTGATLASTTNITAGTITTTTNLTNAPTSGDLTSTMKASVTTAATAATPTAAAVTGNVGGNVVGSVGSVAAAVTLTAAYDAAKLPATEPGSTHTSLMECAGVSGGSYDFWAYDDTAPSKVWNGSSFEVINPLSYASYRIAPTEDASQQSGRFHANAPTGTVSWELRVRGGTMAASTVVAKGSFVPATIKSDTANTVSLIGTVNVSVGADIAAVKTDTGNLVTRITSTLFTGITSLAQMLGLIAGKQVGNTTARTELRATGAGSGTFDETTDSQEAHTDVGVTAKDMTANALSKFIITPTGKTSTDAVNQSVAKETGNLSSGGGSGGGDNITIETNSYQS